MKYLKTLGLAVAAIAFLMSLSVASAYAQPGRAGWKNNNGRSRGWYQGQRNGWNRGRKTGWRNGIYWQGRWYDNNRYYRYGRLSPWEYRRLRYQRMRLYNTRYRYYRNDGYNSYRDRSRYQQRYYNNQRDVYRNRRNW